MLGLRAGLNALSIAGRRWTTTLAADHAPTTTSFGITPPPRPEWQTHAVPVYALPMYGASEEEVNTLPDSMVDRFLKAYGGLFRDRDNPGERRERLLRLTRDRLTISGVVVSDKMNKSIVIAARRRAYAKKLRKEYAVTRRFMAHDEFDLCREGDVVTIRSCRPLSRRKSHVVVRNYGDKMRPGDDKRASQLETLIFGEK